MGKFRYEYECISQQDKVVSKGEFVLKLEDLTIKSPKLLSIGIMHILSHDKKLSPYRGENHLKDIRMKVSNVFTGSVRYFEKNEPVQRRRSNGKLT